MKKRIKNTIVIALTLIMCFVSVNLSPFALETEPGENEAGNINELMPGLENLESLDYLGYLLKHSDSPTAQKPVSVSINTEVYDTSLTFEIEIPSNGLYTICMSYKAIGSTNNAIEFGMKINGETPFAEAEKLLFPRMWQDEEGRRVDGLGNEFAARQIPYDQYRFALALDVNKRTVDPYLVFLTEGVQEITLTPVVGNFELEYFEFGTLKTADTYKAPVDNDKMYHGKPIVIEGENPALKNSYWLSAKTDNSSIKITPNDPMKSLVNYIGGGNWKTSGETIIWETPELPEGYYQLGFLYRQSEVIDGKVYRALTIDGETPFKEAEAIGFMHNDNWQQKFFSDDENNPYLIFLSAGKHEIALMVVPGEISEVRNLLQDAVAQLGALYIDITMITGEKVDIYRDYDLFAQIPDMKERLEIILDTLNTADEKLKEITEKNSNSHSSAIRRMARVVKLMLDNRYTAHRYKTEYYTGYTVAAATLYELQSMPLDIDKFILTAPGQEIAFEAPGVFASIKFFIQKFLSSFLRDYNNISGDSDAGEPVTIWVNWGRDQAQVLNSLVQTSFTAKTDTPVNIQLVNASIVQATLSGKGPDVILQHSRSEPVNLAMRGVLYDLTMFDDLGDVLGQFQHGAEIPYRYKDGLYALPDTQIFYLMYYRNDILAQLELEIPETWEDFQQIIKLLARRNLQVWMPNTPATDINQVNAGIGSNNLFPSLLMQKGLSLYSEEGRSTNLSSSEVMVTFNEWTDYYRKLKIPKVMDFYNRFRTGICPIGITNYTMYTTLKAAAPEIDGLWGVSPIPGTQLADGTISHVSSGGGTACAILKNAKAPKKAWEFLKWWTSAETQLAYSNEVESILGSAGRVALSNTEAFKNLAWDTEMLEPILEAWKQVQEIPEYPGSYYVSRSVYQSFWNVIEEKENKNPKDMLLKFGKQADVEIERKWKQYENR